MDKRRGVYFAFQGLLTAVLLLLYAIHPHQGPWVARFFLLLGLFSASLLFLQFAPAAMLEAWWIQMGLFVGDAVLASLTIHWTEGNPGFFLLYLLVILGTALSRSMLQSFTVAGVTSVLFLISDWHPVHGLPHNSEFWLKLHFLWVTAVLMAILSRDTQQAQRESEEHYQDRLTQLESLATLGRLAGEVAHRIKGPLTTIRVNAEVLTQRMQSSPEVLRELAQIQEEVDRCKTILKDLLSLGRIEEIDLSRLDLRQPLRAALRAIGPQLRAQGLRLAVRGMDRPRPAAGDASMLYEAFLAVLQNAVDASTRGGLIEVRVETSSGRRAWINPLSPHRTQSISIRDEGAGIARKDIERIFRPFYTTKQKEGSGLGLSAALRILQKHEGNVSAFSDGPGRGATFVLTLPTAV